MWDDAYDTNFFQARVKHLYGVEARVCNALVEFILENFGTYTYLIAMARYLQRAV